MNKDNPRQAVAAYVAGYIDGEGTIRVQKARGRKRADGKCSQYNPQVTITSVDEAPLLFIQKHYGGWIRQYQPPSKGDNAREAHQWVLQGRDSVLQLMNDMGPYVLVKARHIELMLEFILEGEDTHPPYPVSDAEIERRERIFNEFKVINARGKRRAAATTERRDT